MCQHLAGLCINELMVMCVIPLALEKYATIKQSVNTQHIVIDYHNKVYSIDRLFRCRVMNESLCPKHITYQNKRVV
jgi:hypothetical protein